MRHLLVTPEEIFLEDKYYFLVDVRSPGEFREASLPGALNVPLFNDEERARVGKVFKDEGVLEAKLKGVELVSPRLHAMLETIVRQAGNSPVCLYCWRGGMRSKMLALLLDFMGLKVFQLQGGYKAYRRFIYRQLEDWKLRQGLVVLNGLTGTGKTVILQRLAPRWPVIDLEGLARHRGSVFGDLGLGRPRGQKDFEALLWQSLYRYRDAPFLLVEGEGRKIGPLYLPPFLVEGIKEGRHLLVQASLETRTSRILEEYVTLDKAKIIQEAARPLRRLEKKLGREKVSSLLHSLQEGDFYRVIKILCRDHYDQKYAESKIGINAFELIVKAEDLEEATSRIEAYLEGLHSRSLNTGIGGESSE